MPKRILSGENAATPTGGADGRLLKLRRLLSKHVGFYSLVSTAPPIFHVARTADPIAEFAVEYRVLFEHLKNRNAYFLCAWYWSVENPAHTSLISELESGLRRQYPGLRFFHLCNTRREVELFLEHDLNAVFCNHNAMIDEEVFKPLPDCRKEYDAVYDARLVAWKRHYLAADLDKLALVYYSDRLADDARYVARIKKDFARARFFNHAADGAYRHLRAAEINRCLNRCRVGLCFSEVEGAMYASGQYLLSGLPVVSTNSRGGRDVFFDDRYVSIVEPRPEAVKEAVEDLINRNVPADFIRQNTLAKMRIHRENFVSLVESIYAGEGVERDFRAEWNRIFFNKLVRTQSHLETIESLEQILK